MEYYRRFHQSKEVSGHVKYEASFSRYELLLYPFVLHQVMTKNDCVPHGMQYYDCKYSTACKDEARKSSGQPYVDNSNKTPKALERDCDSPDSNELLVQFGIILTQMMVWLRVENIVNPFMALVRIT